MRECRICGWYSYKFEAHHCPPAFKVWITAHSNEEDADTVYASGAESAATYYIDNYDHEGDLGPYEVAVVDPDGIRTLWTVQGVETINWRAEPRDPGCGGGAP